MPCSSMPMIFLIMILNGYRVVTQLPTATGLPLLAVIRQRWQAGG